MLKQYIKENWQWIGLWWGLVLISIYSRPLIPIDETRYLSVAWEMWHSNEFLVPHINGLPYSHKPPLLFWLIHLVWLLFGVSEWSARLVGPALGFGCLVFTVELAKTLWPARKDIRLSTPFILLGTGIWSLYGSLSMFDTLLTFTTLTSLVFILETVRNNSVLPWLGLSLTVAMGILAKGPIILIYVLPPITLAPVWWSKDKQFSWGSWYGLSIFSIFLGITIGLWWAVPASFAGGEEYGQAILFKQTAGRLVQSFAHSRPFYWYLLLLPLIFFPWVFWRTFWKGLKLRNTDCSWRFCLCSTVPAVVILSFISGKQLHYILPILPVASLLAAYSVGGVQQRFYMDRIPIAIVYCIISILLFTLPKFGLKGGDKDLLNYLPQAVAIIPLLCGVVFLVLKPNSIANTIKFIAIGSILHISLLQLVLSRPLHDIFGQDDIAEMIQSVQSKGAQVGIFPAHMSDQFQFTGRLTQPLIPNATMDKLVAWSRDNPQSYCVIFTKNKDYHLLQGEGFAKKYRMGWLIFTPAMGLKENYDNWLVQL